MPREQTQGYGIKLGDALAALRPRTRRTSGVCSIASIFLVVTVLVHLIIDDNEVDPTQFAKGIAN
jgi:hypothetical protein